MEWTREKVIARLHEIKRMGYLPIPEGTYRRDDGVVGQVLERQFGVSENNLHLADLGNYELKGGRWKKNRSGVLTLFHKAPDYGLSPLEIFERYSYIKPSKRDGTLKRKLYTTIRGDRENNRGFRLRAGDGQTIALYCHGEFLSSWDLTNGEAKIRKTLFVQAKTRGRVNSRDEQFHYIKALILSEPKDIREAIAAGAVVMDLSIDQPADRSKPPHDRGPHIRIPVNKLKELFGSVEPILE